MNGTNLAAIDVGSNAVRLKIVRGAPPAAGRAVVLEDREPVRSGTGVFRDGNIPAPVMERLVATLARYAAACRLREADGPRLRAVATSAVRQARNRGELVRAVRRAAGLDLEVISGHEEARLVCLGALQGQVLGGRALVLDIGAGSTELVVAEGARALRSWSLPLGGVRLTEQVDGGVSASVEQMRGWVRGVLARELGQHGPTAAATALGTSGTIRALVRFASGGGQRASAQQIARTAARLAAMSVAERLAHFARDRADIIVAGAIILAEVVARLRLAHVEACERGLRDGVLLDLWARQAAEGPRLALG